MQNNVTTGDKGKTNGNGKWMAKSIDEASDQVSSVADSARDMYDRAIKQGSDILTKANKRAGEVVRDYPVQATVGGLVIGFLLGASLFRRRS